MSISKAPVVVGVDGSEPSRRALVWAADEAKAKAATLRVVICEFPSTSRAQTDRRTGSLTLNRVDLDLARRTATRMVDEIRLFRPDLAEVGMRVDSHEGTASEHLVELSAEAQVIVVGARGLDRRSHDYLGSVTTEVTRHASCPVVVIP